MFEYKVRCRHKLGWKEFKLYADTDIEEFFNKNSIDYVRNITDTVENRQLQEIDRLNNIINELEKYINKLMGQTRTAIAFNKGINDIYETKKYERDNDLFEMFLDKLKQLKDSDK